MKSGIYLIKNKINNKIYVGQSIDVKKRIGAHLSYLRGNKHNNPYLQKAFNKYGEDNFEFVVLEFCKIDELDEKEIHYIEKYNSLDYNVGYNLEGGGNLGKVISEVTRLKKCGPNNPMYGKRASLETKSKMVQSSRGKNSKLTEIEVVKIKKMLIAGLEQKQIADIFNVNLSTINKIATFKNWQYVREDLNEQYKRSVEERRREKEGKVIPLLMNNMSIRKISELTGLDRRFVVKVKATLSDNIEITE